MGPCPVPRTCPGRRGGPSGRRRAAEGRREPPRRRPPVRPGTAHHHPPGPPGLARHVLRGCGGGAVAVPRRPGRDADATCSTALLAHHPELPQQRRQLGRGRRSVPHPVGRPHCVPRLIDDDPQQPRPEGRAVPEPSQRPVRLEEGGLHHVLRVGAGTAGHRRPQRHRCVRAHQLRIRLGLPGTYARDHRCLVHDGRSAAPSRVPSRMLTPLMHRASPIGSRPVGAT